MFQGFKKFCEVAFGFRGEDMHPVLGGGQWERLNYGGSNSFGLNQPMLYVPIDISAGSRGNKSEIGKLLGSMRRKFSNTRVTCNRDETKFSKYTCKPTTNVEQGGRTIHVAKFFPTGEAHATVATYPQLRSELWSKHGITTVEEEIDYLRDVHLSTGEKLFNDDTGIKMPVKIKTPVEVTFNIAPFTDGNPLVVLVAAECDRLVEVKKALGLSSSSGYKFHLTVGYANAIWDGVTNDKDIRSPDNAGASAVSGPGSIYKDLHNKTYLDDWHREVGRVVLWDL